MPTGTTRAVLLNHRSAVLLNRQSAVLLNRRNAVLLNRRSAVLLNRRSAASHGGSARPGPAAIRVRIEPKPAVE